MHLSNQNAPGSALGKNFIKDFMIIDFIVHVGGVWMKKQS